ncbi:MAG TPA: class I SAM-dependent methyltransferase [Cellvibrio sp.]|nr:class I SAM-dependent methyltransferase [Cellvibrio sp.]
MSSFSVAWLDLREPADFAARDKTLIKTVLDWLGQKNDPISPDRILVDLGSGTGSTLRTLTKLGASNFVWRLVDLDGKLLDEALKRHGKQLLIEDYQADLTLVNELPLTGANIVTASALFDLASAEFCDALIARIDARKTAFYAALNYDGNTQWKPTHPLDDTVLAAFNQDQLRDKGFGPALGPHATDYLKSTLEKMGFTVEIAASPWQLNGEQQTLVENLITGIAAALAEHSDIDATQLEDWKNFRLQHAATGTCIVGHWDLLALPKKR